MIPNEGLTQQTEPTLEQLLQEAGLGDQPVKKTVKVGDTEVDPTDPAALQTALDSYQRTQRAELDSLRNSVQQLQQNSRYVKNEEDVRPEPTAPVRQTPASRRQRPDDKEWATWMTQDPVEGFKKTLAVAMNLDEGVDPIQVLNGLAAKTMALESEQQKGFKTVQERMEADRIEREGHAFISQHPDYEPNDQNRDMLEAIRVQNGLPPTAQGWHASFLMGQANGHFKAKQQTAQALGGGQSQEVSRNAPKVPSLRQVGTSGSEPDWASLAEQLDAMPSDKARRVIDKLTSFGV